MVAEQHNLGRILGLTIISDLRRDHGLKPSESEGQLAHGEHGDGDDRDVHGHHDHHPIRHGYHVL